MKAVLVIDMPDMCLNCDLYAFQSCYPLQRRIDRDGLKMVDKPEWCPLKPLPRKAELENYSSGLIGMVDTAWMKGYNECLEYIVGETK